MGYLDVHSSETLLLEAHMDTVSHENMVIAPFEPTVRDGLLYGRGSCDTKASLATYLYALSHVLQTGRRIKRNVLVVGVHDEEYSFGGSRELVDNGIRATFAIAGEPTSLNIIYAHKGVCRFRIHTHGVSAHAALPWLGQNAIYAMADVLKQLQQHSLELLDKPHPELGPATLNVGRITGGQAVNIVPAICTAEIDRRLLPGESYSTAKAMIHSSLTNVPHSIEIEAPYMEALGVYNNKDDFACRTVLAATQGAGWRAEFQTAHYGTDASIFSRAGIPTVVFGPGSIELAHTKAEHVPISEIEKAADIIIALLTES